MLDHKVQNQAVLVAVNITKWSNAKTDQDITQEVSLSKNAQDGMIRVRKNLIKSAVVKALSRFMAESIARSLTDTLPSSICCLRSTHSLIGHSPTVLILWSLVFFSSRKSCCTNTPTAAYLRATRLSLRLEAGLQ